MKSHVKKGDAVTVISGGHKGKSGSILAVLPTKSQVIVEGVHMIKKHVKKSQTNQGGGIIEKEGPIHISNVKLVEDKPAKKEVKKKVAKKK